MIEIYDTTLRDGAQSEGISFSLEDKVKIAHLLDEFGVPYLEAGWPSSNPKTLEFFGRLKVEKFKQIKISAFGSTHRAKISPDDDPSIQELMRVRPDVVCIFGKSWDLHAKMVLRIPLSENLKIIENSVKHLRKNGFPVFYDAEHFFDGYKENPDYAKQTLLAALEGGAQRIVLCDTNGGTLPHEVERIMGELPSELHGMLGIHAHNDGDCAVANSLAAVRCGAVQIQGTINGLGERCGNANLVSIIPNLILKMNRKCIPKRNLSKLTSVSRTVSELSNQPHQRNFPWVGKSAFAHKGGVHTHAVKRLARTYEHVDPKLVGNAQRILLSEHSGRENVNVLIERMGLNPEENKDLASALLKELKGLENQGYQFEGAEASFQILARKNMQAARRFFTLEGFHVSISRRGASSIHCEATIKVSVEGKEEHTAAEGDGPVDALDRALRKSLEKFYPCLKDVMLTDYKVRVLDETAGTAAMVRVLIQSRDQDESWGTVGVSTNLIQASWRALVDSLAYKLYKEHGDGKQAKKRAGKAKKAATKSPAVAKKPKGK